MIRNPVIFKDKKNNQITSWSSQDVFGVGANELVINETNKYISLGGMTTYGEKTKQKNLYDVEKIICEILKKESCVLFESQRDASLILIDYLASEKNNDILIVDDFIHPNIKNQLDRFKGKKRIFEHNNIKLLTSILLEYPLSQEKIVLTDTSSYPHGNITNIKEIEVICEKHNAKLIIHETCTLATQIDKKEKTNSYITAGSLSGFGTKNGSYIAADEAILSQIEESITFKRQYNRMSGLTRTIIGLSASLIISRPDFQEKQKNILEKTKNCLQNVGVMCEKTELICLSIRIFSDKTILEICERLLKESLIDVDYCLYPQVQKNMGRIKIIPTINHNENDIERLTSAIQKIVGMNI